jgi:hypothetical protein
LEKGTSVKLGSTLKKKLSKIPRFEHTNRANDENPRLAPWAPFFAAPRLIGSHRG